MDPNIWKTRAVIVHRDENNGYGLTVQGDNPVNVQTIKKGVNINHNLITFIADRKVVKLYSQEELF